MNQLQKVFNYDGSNVTFKTMEGEMFVNATQMAKPFPHKRINDFITSKQTKDLVNALSMSQDGNSRLDLILVQHGGNKNGTWMHKKVALSFAMWLSPVFHSWCLDRIEELLTTGVSFANQDLTYEQMEYIVFSKLKEKAEKTEAKLQEAKARIIKDAPKVELAERITASTHVMDVGEAAKALGLPFGRNLLFKKLREKGIFFKDRNEPKQEYITKRFFEYKPFEKTMNSTKIEGFKVYVTRKGLQFISDLFSDKKQMQLLN